MVVGANGLLGSAIIDLLIEGYGAPASIAALDISAFPTRATEVHTFRGDVRDLHGLVTAFNGVDTVIHTAAVFNFNPKNDAFMRAVNVDGSKNVLTACERNGVQRLVYTSSMNVVFDGRDIADGDESLPYTENPIDSYSATKIAAEKYVLTMPSGVAKCALRATGIYGPKDFLRFAPIVRAVKSGLYVKVGNTNGTKYSHVYSYNLAYAHLLAATSLWKHSKLDGQAFFITDGSTVNFYEFVDRVLAEAGLSTAKKRLPVSVANLLVKLFELWMQMPWVSPTRNPVLTKNAVLTVTRDIWFNSRKAKELFDYEPLFSMNEGIAKTAKWIRETL